MAKELWYSSNRRFGTEIEINSFDMRDRPLGWQDGKLPEGIHYIGNLVKKTINEKILIHKYGNDHYNDCWVVKPDSSCGMEICSPVYKGKYGLDRICEVVDAFGQDKKVIADRRCSFHVHTDISDITQRQLAAVITWWIKCEAVFMDAMPFHRKKNTYCQFLGLSNIFDEVEDGLLNNDILFKRLGKCKYYSLNTYHYRNGKRATIEFRIMDHTCCLNSLSARNWVRLVLHFIERAVERGMPDNYIPKDKWSGYCWLDPIEVFAFLGFCPGQFELSPEIQEMRMWFLNRLMNNIESDNVKGVFGNEGRKVAIRQVKELASVILK